MFIFSNKAIQNIPAIDLFLHEEASMQKTYAVGWGRKPSFKTAQVKSANLNIPTLCLEDGFIRSMGLGKQGYPPLSLVVDQSGIYFDAHQISDLESLITKRESQANNQRARNCIEQILEHKISKYNQKYQKIDPTLFQTAKNILVVDQTYNDHSIHCAGASAESFDHMLQQACFDHPQAQIWLKIHPDVMSKKAKAHFSSNKLKRYQQQFPNLQVIRASYNPIELLQYMDEVYVVSSQMGFEALLCQKKLHCFGVPWYAGWGLTQDEHAPLHILGNRRRIQRSVAHLFACAYLNYARYISATTLQRCELEQLLQELIPNISLQQQLHDPSVLYGFSPWKKKFLNQYLSFPLLKYTYRRYIKPSKQSHVIAWGKKAHALRQRGYKQITTVEDGFIRSIGLGASLIRPHSLVFDSIGIYYDATRPSRLEQLLKQCELNSSQLNRIRLLRQQIIRQNISKYNVGERQATTLAHIQRNKILVVGQVEDDMSIQLGGLDIKTNLGLLCEVRRLNPEAYIIYKPHPDVVAGLRVGDISRQETEQFADRIELHQSITEYFDHIDELHTITSLSGFEALIRGVKVYCYGMPFYAGWGLTLDRHSNVRRNKPLSLEVLMYVALIEYPVYCSYGANESKIPLTHIEHVLQSIESELTASSANKTQKIKSLFLSLIRFKQRL